MVDSPQGLKNNRDESDSCCPAGFRSASHLPVMGICEGIARGGCSSPHYVALQRVHNGDVEGSVLSPSLVGYQDISRLSVVPREEVLPLLDRVEDS